MSEFANTPIPYKTPAEVAAQLQEAVVTNTSVNAAIALDPEATQEALLGGMAVSSIILQNTELVLPSGAIALKDNELSVHNGLLPGGIPLQKKIYRSIFTKQVTNESSGTDIDQLSCGTLVLPPDICVAGLRLSAIIRVKATKAGGPGSLGGENGMLFGLRSTLPQQVPVGFGLFDTDNFEFEYGDFDLTLGLDAVFQEGSPTSQLVIVSTNVAVMGRVYDTGTSAFIDLNRASNSLRDITILADEENGIDFSFGGHRAALTATVIGEFTATPAY